MKITKKQKGILKTLCHNVVNNFDANFSVFEAFLEQKKNLKIISKSKPFKYKISVEYCGETYEKETFWVNE